MLVIPEIHISGGKCVTRTSSSASNVVYDISPMEAVRQYEQQGADRLHILDVDAALGKDERNEALIHEIIESTTSSVQVAGGMRTLHQIDSWFEAGATHVVLGTLAITNPQLLAETCARHPGAILANLATKGGYVMIDGWQTQTAYRPQDLVHDLQMAGVSGIIHFDIDRFEGDSAQSLALTMDLKQDVVIPIYSSGTVHSLDDMARLRYLPNIHGVIIGRALMQRSFSLREVLEVAAQGADSPERESETAVSVLGIQRPLKVYLAAYNLSQAARWWNLDLRQSITDDSPYVEICIPQEDLNIDPKQLRPRDVQAAYEMAIDEADAVVVVLDGIENEAWTGFECGYARARGKQLLGIVCEGDAEYSESCARFEAMCDEVVRYDAGEDRATVFVDVAKELNSRLLSNAVGDATLIDDSEGRRQQQTT